MSKNLRFIQFKSSESNYQESPANVEDDGESNYAQKKSNQSIQEKYKKVWRGCRNMDHSAKLEDGRNRRVIHKYQLLEEVEPEEKKIPSQDLTLRFFQDQPWLQRNVMKKSVRLQKWFAEANSKPINIAKAESMMQKMGWSGGALGRTGSGIVEPIAPNLAYALATKGFGQEPKQVKPTRPQAKGQRRLLKEYETHCFKINVLRTILDFVVNEREVEILFDCQLGNQQRKKIHHLMEAIREIEALSDAKLKAEGATFLQLVYDITRRNRYRLMTQSEGEMPNRYLCLFKEAPPFMYLVTHLDFRNLQKIERQSPINTYMTYKRKRSKNMYLQNKVQKKPEIDDTVLWLVEDFQPPEPVKILGKKAKMLKGVRIEGNTIDESNKTENNPVEGELKTKPDNIDVEKHIVNTDSDINDPNNQIEGPKVITKDMKNNEKDDDVNIPDMDKQENTESCNPFLAAIQSKHKFQEARFNEKFGQNAGNVTDEMIDNASIDDAEDYDLATDSDDDKNDMNSGGRSDDGNSYMNDYETSGNFSNTADMYDGYMNRKVMLHDKVVSCFSEFSQDERYTEFKFLGNFESDEFEVVNEFIRNVWLCLNGQVADEDLMMVIRDAEWGFSLQEDCNGATAIIKVEDKNRPDVKEYSMF